jgi:hypothetical protein
VGEHNEPPPVDIEALLESLRPPRIPDEAFDPGNADLCQITSWRRGHAVARLSGLATVPAFQANGIRIDWLIRLVLAKSDGRCKLKARTLARTLNAGLERAQVLRLEDPIEDLMCDVIATNRGNYRIFSGQWENAGPYTQTLLDAFETLPSHALKSDVLAAVYALLALSEELARRAQVERLTPGGGQPAGSMDIPPDHVLTALARRVTFTPRDIASLGIDANALKPFIIEREQYRYLTDRPVGETPLEFHPLYAGSTGLIVASPPNVSTAVRSVLVSAACTGRMQYPLFLAMMEAQEKYAEVSGFWPMPHLELSPPNRRSMRASVCQFAEGRFLHVIQIPATFDGFPDQGFASVRTLGDEAARFIARDVERFGRFLKDQPDCRQGITAILTSGWGAPHSLHFPIERQQMPENWRFLTLGFTEAAVLGACRDGKFQDICRILEQTDRLEADGYTFTNMNGLLNLFEFWRMTKGNIIPEHFDDVSPPYNVLLPTDGLLIPRTESAKKRDPRSLRHPTQGYKKVQRLDWDDDDDSDLLYGSMEDAIARRFVGAAHIADRTWWIEILDVAEGTQEWSYRLWHATLQWLAAIGPTLIARHSRSFPQGEFVAGIRIEGREIHDTIDADHADTQALEATLTCVSDGPRICRLTVLRAWTEQLWRPDNDAEIELVAAILGGFVAQSAPLSREELRAAIKAAIGSAPACRLWAQARKRSPSARRCLDA